MRSNVVSKMMLGATLDPFGLVLLKFDNIGFKILGQCASYSSFTLFQEMHIKQSRNRTRYMHTYNVNTPYKVERSQKESDGGVNLGRLLVTTTDRDKELKRLLMRGTSVDEGELAAVFIVKELDAEDAKLLDLLKRSIHNVTSNALKEDM